MAILSAPPASASLISRLAVAPDAETREVHAPFSGELLYRLPLATEYDVASAAARARSAESWSLTRADRRPPSSERAASRRPAAPSYPSTDDAKRLTSSSKGGRSHGGLWPPAARAKSPITASSSAARARRAGLAASHSRTWRDVSGPDSGQRGQDQRLRSAPPLPMRSAVRPQGSHSHMASRRKWRLSEDPDALPSLNAAQSSSSSAALASRP